MIFTGWSRPCGVDSRDLGLETHRECLCENLMEISDAVNRFREAGYPILLDDFGSDFPVSTC